MFDFRYHALSLVAVFLALAIGILLGVTIGDSLLSQADKGLRASLHEDVEQARDQEAEAVRGLEAREELIGVVLPGLVGNRLEGTRVAMVGIGQIPEGLEASVRSVVEQAGGTIDSVSVIPADPSQLATELGMPAQSTDLEPELAGRLAALVTEGGRDAQRLREGLPDDFTGSYQGAEAVVFHGLPPGRAADAAQGWETALLDVLKSDGANVVGVEETGPAERSQTRFYADQEISSVDNVDTAGGQIALVFALQGEQGQFGYQDSAEEVLPPPRAVR